jgi:hypothetical protein
LTFLLSPSSSPQHGICFLRFGCSVTLAQAKLNMMLHTYLQKCKNRSNFYIRKFSWRQISISGTWVIFVSMYTTFFWKERREKSSSKSYKMFKLCITTYLRQESKNQICLLCLLCLRFQFYIVPKAMDRTDTSLHLLLRWSQGYIFWNKIVL